MNVLDLFSGIGGFSLGLERAGMRTVAFCEFDPWCRAVLRKHWPDVPIHDDIRTLDGERYRGTVELVCGGFPCQPFSQAGVRRGADDDRHLWPEMFRVIREVQPAYVVGENVIGLETLGLADCVADLESIGYGVQVFDIPACGVGAPHRRHRLWIVAHASSPEWRANDQRRNGRASSALTGNGEVRPAADTSGNRGWANAGAGPRVSPEPAELLGENRQALPGDAAESSRGAVAHTGHDEGRRVEPERGQERRDTQPSRNGEGGFASNTNKGGERGQPIDAEVAEPSQAAANPGRGRGEGPRDGFGKAWRLTEPPLCRADDGVPRRLDRIARLRMLGNSVVPQIVEEIGRAIMTEAR